MSWAESEQRVRAVDRHLAVLREATLDEFEMMHPRGRLGRWVRKGLSVRGVPGGEGAGHVIASMTAHVDGKPRRVHITAVRRRRFGPGMLSPMQQREREARGLPVKVPESATASFHALARDDQGLWYVWTQRHGRDGFLTPAVTQARWDPLTGGGTEYAFGQLLAGHLAACWRQGDGPFDLVLQLTYVARPVLGH